MTMGPEPMIMIFFKSVRFAIRNPPYLKNVDYKKMPGSEKWKPRQIPGMIEKENKTETESKARSVVIAAI